MMVRGWLGLPGLPASSVVQLNGSQTACRNSEVLSTPDQFCSLPAEGSGSIWFHLVPLACETVIVTGETP